ncbi:hypothetical protein EVAR_91434_1 [Eumeta japonica]|uniref:Uncharacterized protein n=1 Tax=Eumeta variegata TaxID=151549 RepID=A0A4C1X1F7_EUMVA|nr:hypothetical protein EVAR_91434_1 [Eumeta japonica]
MRRAFNSDAARPPHLGARSPRPPPPARLAVIPHSRSLFFVIRMPPTFLLSRLRNKELEFVNSTVFLGITLDNRLQLGPYKCCEPVADQSAHRQNTDERMRQNYEGRLSVFGTQQNTRVVTNVRTVRAFDVASRGKTSRRALDMNNIPVNFGEFPCLREHIKPLAPVAVPASVTTAVRSPHPAGPAQGV